MCYGVIACVRARVWLFSACGCACVALPREQAWTGAADHKQVGRGVVHWHLGAIQAGIGPVRGSALVAAHGAPLFNSSR